MTTPSVREALSEVMAAVEKIGDLQHGTTREAWDKANDRLAAAMAGACHALAEPPDGSYDNVARRVRDVQAAIERATLAAKVAGRTHETREESLAAMQAAKDAEAEAIELLAGAVRFAWHEGALAEPDRRIPRECTEQMITAAVGEGAEWWYLRDSFARRWRAAYDAAIRDDEGRQGEKHSGDQDCVIVAKRDDLQTSERKASESLLGDLIALWPDIRQLVDGFMTDPAWNKEWDLSVREKMTAFALKHLVE